MRYSILALLLMTMAFAIIMVAWKRTTRPMPFTGIAAMEINGGRSMTRGFHDPTRGYLTLQLDSDAVAATPEWPVWQNNPPLNPREALIIADQHRQSRLDDDSHDWVLGNLALTPLDIATNKWCWVANFMGRPKNPASVNVNGAQYASPAPRDEVWIMMDGTILESKLQRDSVFAPPQFPSGAASGFTQRVPVHRIPEPGSPMAIGPPSANSDEPRIAPE